MNDKDSRHVVAYVSVMRPILLLFLLLLAAAEPPVRSGPLLECDGAGCVGVELSALRLQGRQTDLRRMVDVAPSALPLDRPLMVRIVAMASSEVRWNGALIGRNGVPGPDAASEQAGQFAVRFIIPPGLVRAGGNRLDIRLSAQHLWLPVLRPVHLIEVMRYDGDALTGLSDYLPALLALGALIAVGIYFAAAFATAREGGALLLALAAAAASLQLLAEVSRAFIAYDYPWHLARVSAIALLAAATSLCLVGYAVRRFAPAWRRTLLPAAGLATVAGLLLPPWFDIKAMSAILVGAVATAVCAGHAIRARGPGALAALAASLGTVALMAWELTDFLDRAWFILLAVVLVALAAEQAKLVRRARAERDAEVRRAADLAERLARAERSGEPILSLKDGARSHRVAEGDLLYLRAADDYCEAVTVSGGTLLVTMTLSQLLGRLPAGFVRVHKSYAVNLAHVTGSNPRAGGGRLLRLSSGAEVPVGRTYGPAVAQALVAS